MARALRWFGLCCLVLGIITALSSTATQDAPNESNTAAGTCISKADYESTIQQVEALKAQLGSCDVKELERTKSQLEEAKSQLEQTKSQSDEAKSQLAALTNQKATCDNVSASLFQRVKEMEKDASTLKSQLEEKFKEGRSCKDEVNELTQKSASLSTTYQSQIQSAEQALGKCKEDLVSGSKSQAEVSLSTESALSQCKQDLTTIGTETETVQRQMREQEQKFKSEINNFIAFMQKAENEYSSETKELRAQLDESKSQETYLFSFSQFKRTVAKAAALNKALVLFVRSKVEPILPELPPTLSEDLRVQYGQARVALGEVYQSYVGTVVAPHVATLRKIYEENAAVHVKQVRQLATESALAAWSEIKVQALDYSERMHDWTQTHVILPFVASHPIVKDLVPASTTDQLFALMYLVLIMFISACLMRILLCYLVKPLFNILTALLFFPCRVAGRLICPRRSPAAAKKIVTKKEVRKEPSLKQEVKKEAKKEGIKKSPKRG